jgi:hypothetical protein
MTTFEQTVLVYKKKKYTNQKLREQIEYLKNHLAIKKQKVNKIKDINQNCVWNTVSLLKNEDGEFFFDSNMNELSIVNKTCENMEFEIDVSKILKPSNKVRTLAAMIQEKKQKLAEISISQDNREEIGTT